MKKLLCALALLALVIVLLPAQEARAEYHDGDLCPQCNLNPLYVFYTDENFHTVTCSTCGYTTTEFHFGGMATPIDGPQCEGCGETYGAPVDPIEVNCVYYVAGQYYLTKINPPQSYDCHYQMDWWTGPVEFNEVVEIGGNYYLAANVDTMVYKAAGGLYISYVPGWPATCTENGQEDYWQCRICKRMYSEKACENQIQEPVVIPAGHDLVEVKKVEPTCATPGTEAYWVCQRDGCGKKFSDEQATNEIQEPVPIAALGHAWALDTEQGDGGWTWAADGRSATAHLKCTRDGCNGSAAPTDSSPVAGSPVYHPDTGKVNVPFTASVTQDGQTFTGETTLALDYTAYYYQATFYDGDGSPLGEAYILQGHGGTDDPVGYLVDQYAHNHSETIN